MSIITFRDSRLQEPEGQQSIVDSLNALKREVVCGYGSPLGRMCDCKYGLAERPHGAARQRPGDEACGCPELAEAIGILRALTPAEWKRVVRRVFPNQRRAKARRDLPAPPKAAQP